MTWSLETSKQTKHSIKVGGSRAEAWDLLESSYGVSRSSQPFPAMLLLFAHGDIPP